MRQEVDEIPEAVARLLDRSGKTLIETGQRLANLDPTVLATIARGSSDHAAFFLKYACEQTLGIPVASLGPSLSSIYKITPRLKGAAALAISQSGKSPDIVSLAEACRKGGGLTIALANTVPSPLTETSDIAIDIQAGPEKSVAATKSFVNSIVAGLYIIASWSDDKELNQAIIALPEHFSNAVKLDWSPFNISMEGSSSVFILGRGPGFAIACEAALKLKETCGLHAEAYSSAEVVHGPMEMVRPSFPVLALAARDAAENTILSVANNLRERGAKLGITSEKAPLDARLPYIETGHPITDALVLIAPFYAFAEAYSRKLGRNPDAPAHLNKVTETR